MSEKLLDLPVLGLMSGTSLDGLDMAICHFTEQGPGYAFEILHSKTIHYTSEWRERLGNVSRLDGEAYFKLHVQYGHFMAQQVLAFLKEARIGSAVLASHGHTVFHRPALGFSTQLGCGATLAAHTGLTTVCDFRSLDVALGGQGAPLVPIGDRLLFGHYNACLNVGGIANLSFESRQGERIAYDICEANMLLNCLANYAGHDYDEDGHMARSGRADRQLLSRLNLQDYYQQKGAKSLGREWFENHILPILQASSLSHTDLLATAAAHVSDCIAMALNENEITEVLVTGGGAWNSYLIDLLRSKTEAQLIVPNAQVVNFKEALVFAFLGYLRLNKRVNTLGSVTGARTDSIGGAVYLGG